MGQSKAWPLLVHMPAFRWQRGINRLLLVSLVCGLACQSCSAWTQRIAVQTISQIIADGLPAYRRESDLLLAEQALAANVKLGEALLETDPHNPTLLLQATQGFATYTYAFVEAQIAEARGQDLQRVMFHTQRAQQLYHRGLHYGWRLLSRYDPAWKQAPSLELTSFMTHLQQLTVEAMPALFWTAFCWGGLLNMEREALETITAWPRLEAMLARLLELDETYFYGAPHLLQAVQYASRTPLLGGNPAQAQHHFARARSLSAGRLLLVLLLEAQYYATQIQDRSLFTTRLQQILDAPDTLFPEQALLNAVAKHRGSHVKRDTL